MNWKNDHLQWQKTKHAQFIVCLQFIIANWLKHVRTERTHILDTYTFLWNGGRIPYTEWRHHIDIHRKWTSLPVGHIQSCQSVNLRKKYIVMKSEWNTLNSKSGNTFITKKTLHLTFTYIFSVLITILCLTWNF